MNYDKLHVIGFLLDYTNSEMLNANNVISTYVGVNNNRFDEGISVYPNPCGDYTNVAFTLDQSGKAVLDVYDMFGKHVYSVVSLDYAAGQNMIRINSRGFKNGMYLVRLSVNNQVISRIVSVIK